MRVIINPHFFVGSESITATVDEAVIAVLVDTGAH